MRSTKDFRAQRPTEYADAIAALEQALPLLGDGEVSVRARKALKKVRAYHNRQGRLRGYARAAKDGFGAVSPSEGSLEVDPDAQVSCGAEKGVYVQAWIWVSDEALERYRTANRRTT
jgi:hypothetical protein